MIKSPFGIYLILLKYNPYMEIDITYKENNNYAYSNTITIIILLS